MIKKISKDIKIFNSSYFIFIVFILFFVSLSSLLAYYPENNFWIILYTTLTSSFRSAILLLTILLMTLSLSVKYKNSMIIIRNNGYEAYLKMMLKKVVIFTIILMFISFLFVLIGTIFRANMKFDLYSFKIYDLPAFIYLIFYLLRKAIFIILITAIIFYSYNLFNKTFVFILVFFIVCVSFLHVHTDMITNIINIPLLFCDYFNNIIYSNIFLEISGSIIQFFILSGIIGILEKKLSLLSKDIL